MNVPQKSGRKIRLIEDLVHEICASDGITLRSYSADWIYRFEKNARSGFLFGYDFDLNSATAKTIAKDKAATAELLQAAEVPSIPHHLVHHPDLRAYVPSEGNWTRLLELLERSNRALVCKSNDGTGGIDVYRARTERELESAVTNLLARRRSCAVSPYVAIDREVRVFVLNGEAHILYEKERESLVGDGVRSVQELLVERLSQSSDLLGDLRALGAAFPPEVLARVPSRREEIVLNWKHNLGQGSAARLMSANDPLRGRLETIACRGAGAIALAVGAVDLVVSGDEVRVLEINSGVMMESFGRQSAETLAIARGFYAKILSAMLG